MIESDLDAIMQTATIFLNMDIKDTPFSPMIVQHPIFESGYIGIIQNGKYKPVNICDDEIAREEVLSQYYKRIDLCKSAAEVYQIVRKSYKLTFLKYIWRYLNVKDKCELMRDAWITSEDPNQDANVSIPELERMFKDTVRKSLMKEEEIAFLNSLPDEFEIYRGVAVGRNPNGLSWTPSEKIATWFAHRFDKKGKQGYIKKGLVQKDAVLAYFNGRDEEEIVVPINKIRIMGNNIDSI